MQLVKSDALPTITVGGVVYKRLDFENEMTIAQFEGLLKTVAEVTPLISGEIESAKFIGEVIKTVIEKKLHERILAQLYFDESGKSIEGGFGGVKFAEVLRALRDFFDSMKTAIMGGFQTYSAAKG